MQEPGNNKEVQEFARTHYGVTFPVFAKVRLSFCRALVGLIKWIGNRTDFYFLVGLVRMDDWGLVCTQSVIYLQ